MNPEEKKITINKKRFRLSFARNAQPQSSESRETKTVNNTISSQNISDSFLFEATSVEEIFKEIGVPIKKLNTYFMYYDLMKLCYSNLKKSAELLEFANEINKIVYFPSIQERTVNENHLSTFYLFIGLVKNTIICKFGCAENIELLDLNMFNKIYSKQSMKIFKNYESELKNIFSFYCKNNNFKNKRNTKFTYILNSQKDIELFKNIFSSSENKYQYEIIMNEENKPYLLINKLKEENKKYKKSNISQKRKITKFEKEKTKHSREIQEKDEIIKFLSAENEKKEKNIQLLKTEIMLLKKQLKDEQQKNESNPFN